MSQLKKVKCEECGKMYTQRGIHIHKARQHPPTEIKANKIIINGKKFILKWKSLRDGMMEKVTAKFRKMKDDDTNSKV